MKRKIKYPEGGDTPVQASLYQRLLSKGIINNSLTEAQFGSLPKEQIDAYFKQYGQVIGAKTQEQVNAMPGDKTYLQPTIFTGVQQKDFDSAFVNARQSGLQTFSYNGKDYNTQVDPNAQASQGTQTKSDLMMNIAGKEFADGGNPQYDAVTGALSPLIGMIPGGQFLNMGPT